MTSESGNAETVEVNIDDLINDTSDLAKAGAEAGFPIDDILEDSSSNEPEATADESQEVNTDVKTLFGMSNKTYDVLKWIAQIFLPTFVVFYSAVASIWHIPFTVEIVGTISAIDALMGGMLHVSTKEYNKTQA